MRKRLALQQRQHPHHTPLFITSDPVPEDRHHPILQQPVAIVLFFYLIKGFHTALFQVAVVRIFHFDHDPDRIVVDRDEDITEAFSGLSVGDDPPVFPMAQKT